MTAPTLDWAQLSPLPLTTERTASHHRFTLSEMTKGVSKALIISCFSIFPNVDQGGSQDFNRRLGLPEVYKLLLRRRDIRWKRVRFLIPDSWQPWTIWKNHTLTHTHTHDVNWWAQHMYIDKVLALSLSRQGLCSRRLQRRLSLSLLKIACDLPGTKYISFQYTYEVISGSAFRHMGFENAWGCQ